MFTWCSGHETCGVLYTWFISHWCFQLFWFVCCSFASFLQYIYFYFCDFCLINFPHILYFNVWFFLCKSFHQWFLWFLYFHMLFLLLFFFFFLFFYTQCIYVSLWCHMWFIFIHMWIFCTCYFYVIHLRVIYLFSPCDSFTHNWSIFTLHVTRDSFTFPCDSSSNDSFIFTCESSANDSSTFTCESSANATFIFYTWFVYRWFISFPSVFFYKHIYLFSHLILYMIHFSHVIILQNDSFIVSCD